MARTFVAKAVYDMPTTRVLLDRLDTDAALRRIYGWEKKSAVPSESVFSRAFAEFSDTLGHVPLIDVNPRADKTLAEELRTESRRLERIGFQLPEQVRYNERTAGERVNGRLKDEFGGRHVRVRGASKVMCHCMFGVLALTADQLVRLVT